MIQAFFAQADTPNQSVLTLLLLGILPLVGVALGALLNNLWARQRQKQEEKIEKRKFMVSKLEEAHQIACSIKSFYCSNILDIQVFLQEYHTREVVQKVRDRIHHHLQSYEHGQLSMIIDFHFPELDSHLKTLNDAQEKYEVILSFIYTQIEGMNQESHKEEIGLLRDAYSEVVRVVLSIQNELAALARKL